MNHLQFSPWITNLGWTLFHSLWQGTAILREELIKDQYFKTGEGLTDIEMRDNDIKFNNKPIKDKDKSAHAIPDTSAKTTRQKGLQ